MNGMNRCFKAGAVAIGLVLGGAVAAGAVDLPNLDTGSGITLCFDSKGAAVRGTSTNGTTCPARTAGSAVVATQEQVDAIEAAHNAAEDRVAALESSNAALQASNDQQADAIDALEARVLALEPGTLTIAGFGDPPGINWTFSEVTGQRLQPGAEVIMHETFEGEQRSVRYSRVLEDGTVPPAFNTRYSCELRDIYLSSTDHQGNEVRSNVFSTGPDC